MLLASTTADVDAAHEQSRLAIVFDLEDSSPLEGDLSRIREFYHLGVRTMLPTYNRRNAAGCGCLDQEDEDTGLTEYGRQIVTEMNRVGMVADGSHCSVRTGLDISETSSQPMVYSHTAMRTLWDHPRNIIDEQAIACAAGGGVIGVTGVRHLLGAEGPLLKGALRHVRYLIDLVGVEHVGLATDYVFDQAALIANIASHPELYPKVTPPRGPDSYMAPEELLRAQDALSEDGLSDEHVAKILGGNFHRVARTVWK